MIIVININDDYQEFGKEFWTDARVESTCLTDEEEDNCLNIIKDFIFKNVDFFSEVEMTKIGKQLIFQNLYHEERLKLINVLNNSKLKIGNYDLFFISES